MVQTPVNELSQAKLRIQELEQQLAENQALLRQLIEHIPMSVAIFNENVEYLHANRMWVEGYQIQDREIIGHSHYEIFPEIGDDWKQIHQRWLAGHIDKNEQAPFPHTNGHLDWLRWDVRPWYKADDQTVGGLLMYTEVITERVENARIAENVSRSERQYRQILDAIDDMVLVKGEKSKIIWANRAFRDYYGMSEEALQGIIDAPHVEPDYTQQYILDDAKVFNSGEPLNIPAEPVKKYDGTVRLFNTLKTPIFDENGQVIMTVGVSRDITEHQKADESIRQSEARYRALVEDNPDYIVVIDAEGRIEFINHIPEEISEQIHRQSIYDFVTPEQALSIRQGVQQVLETNKQIQYEGHGTRRGTQEIGWLTTRIVPTESHDGRIASFTIISTDITERKQAESEREQLIKDLKVANRLAQENARLKSEFLSTMSHELRTPLNAIEGFTSIMLSDMGVELDPKARGMIERVSMNSKRLLNLINDFLDLSRIESGRFELAQSPLSPSRLAEKWKSEVSVLAENKGLGFNVLVDDNLPHTFYGDEESISKIAINLLSNAIKFTHRGSISLNLKRERNQLLIEVSDTGIGIPPHARDYIFDEFRQVDGSSKRLYGGTGLGLAIVQKLTRLMNGTVSVRSQLNEGSTFTIALPMIDKVN